MFGKRFTIFMGINVMPVTVFSLILVVESILIFILNAEALSDISTVAIWIFGLIGIPFALLQILFMISNRPVLGANDNLSGMAVYYELAKTFNSPENRPKSVEVWIAAFGCEETETHEVWRGCDLSVLSDHRKGEMSCAGSGHS